MRWIFALASLLLAPSLASAQQNQCRTAPVGTSTGYCASEAFVTQAFKMPLIATQKFAVLPACNSAIEGALAAVTDSMTATWGAIITGSGTNHVLGYCDGVNWTVAGK